MNEYFVVTRYDEPECLSSCLVVVHHIFATDHNPVLDFCVTTYDARLDDVDCVSDHNTFFTIDGVLHCISDAEHMPPIDAFV